MESNSNVHQQLCGWTKGSVLIQYSVTQKRMPYHHMPQNGQIFVPSERSQSQYHSLFDFIHMKSQNREIGGYTGLEEQVCGNKRIVAKGYEVSLYD